jgi:thiol peroxidase
MHERHGFVTSKGNPLTLVGDAPEVGSKAPNFTVLTNELTPFSLSDAAGKVVVVNSVGSLDTSVCAAQTRRFNEEAAGLGEQVRVLVISMDLPFAQKRFRSTEGITNLDTLSDHRDASFGTAYGLLVKETRLLARAVLAIDRAGLVQYVQLVPEVGQEPDYDDAMMAIKKLL